MAREPMRLNKYLAHCGVASRRESDRLIQQGHVVVNGSVELDPATRVTPLEDIVEYDGDLLELERKVYYLYHKPEGVATTLEDPNIDETLEPVVREVDQRIYPVGRLDQDSSGLLLLTNDGDLANAITHPKHGVEKEYRVRLSEPVPESVLQVMREKGVHLDGRQTQPARIERIDEKILVMGLKEGRNRQIRRMFDRFNYQVEDLLRRRIGPLELGELEPGERRELTEQEVDHLRELTLDD